MKKKGVPDIPSFPPVPPGAPTGWMCPKCGTVNAPHVKVCQGCCVPEIVINIPSAPPNGVPDVQCGAETTAWERKRDSILRGGHQSTGPK